MPDPRAAAPVLALLAACTAPPASHAAPAPIDGQWLRAPRSLWFGVYVDGHKAGHSHTLTRVEDRPGGPVFVRRSGMTFRALHDGAPLDSTTENVEEYEAEPPYRLLRWLQHLSRRGESSSTLLTRAGGSLSIEIERDGMRRALTPDADLDFDLRDALAEACWVRGSPPVGATLTVRAFDTDSFAGGGGATRVVTVTLLDRGRSTLGGVQVPWFDVERRTPGEAGVERTRIDGAGQPLRWSLGSFELRREPEAWARRPAALPDLFAIGRVPLDAPLGEGRALGPIVLRADGAGTAALVNAPGQRVERLHRTAVRITLDPRGLPGPAASSAEIEDACRATLRHPWREPEILALARRAVGDATTDREKVERLCEFVAAFVEDSYTDADHPTVQHVIERRCGDCTDHALLFTTLARAAGVPARAAAGLVYLGDEEQAFGPHDWSEVVLAGRWTAVDPTFAQAPADTAHLRLHVGDGATPPAPGFSVQVLEPRPGGGQ